MRVVVWEKAEAKQGVLSEQEERLGGGFRCLDGSADGTSHKFYHSKAKLYVLNGLLVVILVHPHSSNAIQIYFGNPSLSLRYLMCSGTSSRALNLQTSYSRLSPTSATHSVAAWS